MLNLLNKIVMSFLSFYLAKLKSGSLQPYNCPIPCHHIKYEARNSYAAYPNEGVAEQLFRKYNVTKGYLE